MNRRLQFAGFCLVAAALLALWLIPALHDTRERAATPPPTQVDTNPTPVPIPNPNPTPTPTPTPTPNPNPTPTPNLTTASAPKPLSKIRIAFESEPRDADAPAVEARIRDIYAAEPLAKGVLRQVRCSQTVCKIDARWSSQLNRGYNAALMQVIREYTREVSFEPDGPPDALGNPITLYVRRPAHPAPVPAATAPENGAHSP